MRLGLVQKSAIWTTTIVVAATGLAWFALHDVIETEPGETERLLLMLHGIAAYVVLIVIGSLLPLHVRSGWHRRRKRWTGGMTLTALGLLGATGLMLYYGGEQVRDVARWIHIGVGLACMALLPVHAMLAVAAKRSAGVPDTPHVTATEGTNRLASAER